ncbi:MAG: hypothetical protein M9918_04740 [Anaerolineae bacterium]|nr:hypothetical protein [Anaerolineae bacterium]
MSLKYTLKWLGTALLAIMLTSCGGTAEDITLSNCNCNDLIASESITPNATPAAIMTAHSNLATPDRANISANTDSDPTVGT